MTLRQRLRGLLTTDPHVAALAAHRITYDAPGTIAERMSADWEGATVRDPVLRETMDRIAVRADQAAVSWIWKFADESRLTANDRGVWVL